MPSRRLAPGPCLLALLIATATTGHAVAAEPTPYRVTKVSANNGFGGDHDSETRGRVFIETPPALVRISRNGLRTAEFRMTTGPSCTIRLLVATRNVATPVGPRTQVDRATRRAIGFVGAGAGTAGPWRAVEIRDGDVHSKHRVRRIYALASKRVAARRYVQVRAFGAADLSCTDADVRSGAFAGRLAHLMGTARIDVRVVRA